MFRCPFSVPERKITMLYYDKDLDQNKEHDGCEPMKKD